MSGLSVALHLGTLETTTVLWLGYGDGHGLARQAVAFCVKANFQIYLFSMHLTFTTADAFLGEERKRGYIRLR